MLFLDIVKAVKFVVFEAMCNLTNEPQNESCRNLLCFLAPTLVPIQPACWGIWSSQCTCQQKIIMITTIAIITIIIIQHRLKLLREVLYLHWSEFVFIAYIFWFHEHLFCIDLYIKDPAGETNAFCFALQNWTMGDKQPSCKCCLSNIKAKSGNHSLIYMCDSEKWRWRKWNIEKLK